MVDSPMQKPLTDDWTVPRPPPEARPQGIRGVRVSIGITIAAAGHLLTIIVLYVSSALAGDGWLDSTGRWVLLGGQALLAAACLVTGLVLAIRRDSGIGIGLIIGWAAGVPVVVYQFLAEWLFITVGGD
jgi:hypothetical protein